MNICEICQKIYMRKCPLNKHGPNNMIRCSAYEVSTYNRKQSEENEKRITALETYKKELRAYDSFDNIDGRIEELEKNTKGNNKIVEELRGFAYNLKRLENNIKDLSLGNTAKLLNQNKIVADYAELLEQISVTRGEMDEVFNRLEHHAAFYPRFKKIEKILTRFMKIFTKPLLDIDWTQTYRKVEKLIRELNR